MEIFCQQKAVEFENTVQHCANQSIIKHNVDYQQLRKNKGKIVYKPVYDFMLNHQNIPCMPVILDRYYVRVFENANKTFANLAHGNGVEIAANYIAKEIVSRRLKDLLTGDEFSMFGNSSKLRLERRMSYAHSLKKKKSSVFTDIKYILSL